MRHTKSTNRTPLAWQVLLIGWAMKPFHGHCVLAVGVAVGIAGCVGGTGVKSGIVVVFVRIVGVVCTVVMRASVQGSVVVVGILVLCVG